MRIDILTLFPEMFDGPLNSSIIGLARQRDLLEVRVINIRDFTYDRHQVADDYPFGGGGGMVMKPEPIFEAVEHVLAGTGKGAPPSSRPRVILLCPQGKTFSQAKAAELSRAGHLVFICGHYEGVDERVRSIVDEELSIGDYVITGGELAAMVVVDAVARLIPGVLGSAGGAWQDSFALGILEGPQYTRPREYRGMAVPEVLLSGDHERIRRWRRKEALRRTMARRPDLLAKVDLSAEDRELVAEIQAEAPGEN